MHIKSSLLLLGGLLVAACGSNATDGGGGGATFTFAIPDGFALPDGLAVGSSVEARGDMVAGVLTLTRIELEDVGGDG